MLETACKHLQLEMYTGQVYPTGPDSRQGDVGALATLELDNDQCRVRVRGGRRNRDSSRSTRFLVRTDSTGVTLL